MLRYISKILLLVALWQPTFAADDATADTTVDNRPVVRNRLMPTFQDEEYSVFRHWLITHIEYPKRAHRKGIEGNVIISFVVDRDGYPSKIAVVSTPHPMLASEVIRVIKSSPQWIPASKNGKYLPVRLAYNVVFTI